MNSNQGEQPYWFQDHPAGQPDNHEELSGDDERYNDQELKGNCDSI